MELKLPGPKGIVRSVAFTLDDSKIRTGSAGMNILSFRSE